MSNNDMFDQKEFPVWEGYGERDKHIKLVKELWLNDIDFMAKSLHEVILEKEYFRDILRYIQKKLDLDEPLNLCLDSSKEVLGIMIVPCEICEEYKEKEEEKDGI